MSISTSGDYVRYIDKENHHILNSREGKSVHYYSSMSIMQNGWNIDYLDAYATACFNLPLNEIEELKDSLSISLLIIDKKNTISLLSPDSLNLQWECNKFCVST